MIVVPVWIINAEKLSSSLIFNGAVTACECVHPHHLIGNAYLHAVARLEFPVRLDTVTTLRVHHIVQPTWFIPASDEEPFQGEWMNVFPLVFGHKLDRFSSGWPWPTRPVAPPLLSTSFGIAATIHLWKCRQRESQTDRLMKWQLQRLGDTQNKM